MSKVEYCDFSAIAPAEFLPLLNSDKNREHLIEHEKFDASKAAAWMANKLEMNGYTGCRIRAIYKNKTLAGWCGIQLDDGKYELAIVLDSGFWGLGRTVFNDMMRWARELNHDEIYIHFLHTRPEYQFLKKMAKTVYQTELMGSCFTTYQLAVPD
ncbi:N-acetyltransferase [Teredinibacter turnerae]|uniref:hypothetical protein n=1 Tax=Teredinibacter turnerae TaxID=2426 RepID=UPI00037B258C|nr:hypothetical protein [Teredinibacter turnerae]